MRALRRLSLVAVVAAAAGGAFVYLQRTEPPWWARLWFPLRYTAIVRGHSAHYRLNPALLAAVIDEESKFDAGARSRTELRRQILAVLGPVFVPGDGTVRGTR